MNFIYWKSRLFVKWLCGALHLNDLVGMIEYCDDCGRKQPLVWWSDDDLWFDTMPNSGGALCPECFSRRFDGKYILQWWPKIAHVIDRKSGDTVL